MTVKILPTFGGVHPLNNRIYVGKSCTYYLLETQFEIMFARRALRTSLRFPWPPVADKSHIDINLVQFELIVKRRQMGQASVPFKTEPLDNSFYCSKPLEI
jgi:hypothetical protein